MSPLPGRRSASAVGPVGGLSFDEWQFYFNLVIVIIACIDIRPIGLQGKGLALLVLLVVNSALVLQRAVPDRIIRPRLRLWLLVVGVLAAALIMGLDSNSWAVAFPFLIAGHAGFKLPARAAIAVAAATSAACIVALIVAGHHEGSVAPWYLGAFTGLPVFIGQSNRGYRQAVEAAHVALQEAERASAAEARAQTLAERGRIARDVHDLLAHSLAGINLQLEVADALLEQGRPDEARAATHKAQSLVREGLTEVGRTVSALRDATLPLQETLERMLETAGGPTDGLTVTGTPRSIATEVGQVVVRTAQEGLTNAHKHAPGGAVHLTLAYGEGQVGLTVVNEPAATPAGAPDGADASTDASGSGLGLVGMRERVELAGGRAVIGPTSGGGWSIEIELPT